MFEQYLFKSADLAERLEALELQRTVYASEVGYAPHDNLDEGAAKYFVAINNQREVVGSFRIVEPECRPFDIEEYIDLHEFIPPDHLIGLVGRLCVRQDSRSVARDGLLPLGLLKLAYEFALDRGITDLVMYTFPHLQRFYERAFFKFVGRSFMHPGYDCEMLVMNLDVAGIGARRRPDGSWARMLFGPRWPNIIL